MQQIFLHYNFLYQCHYRGLVNIITTFFIKCHLDVEQNKTLIHSRTNTGLSNVHQMYTFGTTHNYSDYPSFLFSIDLINKLHSYKTLV